MFIIRLQEWIHRLEVGAGARVIRVVFLSLMFGAVAVLYDGLCFRNLATEEAMDTAQLARNIAEKRSFTTHVVRPFSIFLIERHHADRSPQLHEHPDLANAPLYPLLLAPVMKAVPVQDMVAQKAYSVVWADLAIAIVNQILMLVATLLVFRLARQWFDRTVAFLAAILFALTELYWRFSVSGLSTMLLIVLVLLLAWLLTRLDERSREGSSAGRLVAISFGIGLVLGALVLTRYACGFLLLPVLIFIAAFVPAHRAKLIVVVALTFFAVLAPWMARNIVVSGTPFGVAGYAGMDQTSPFPRDHLERSLHPRLYAVVTAEYMRKLVVNARVVLTNDLPRLGGNWLWAFFLAGLLVRFQSPTLSRLRWFVVIALATFLPVQAVGKTHIAADSPDVNSENLLVLLSPLVLIFAMGVFFVLLDSFTTFETARARWAAWAGFVAAMAMPFVIAMVPPHASVAVYPPYWPPLLQQMGSWLAPQEMMMSDIPAGVAWYGKRQCSALPLDPVDDLLEINDFKKPVAGVLLTVRTTEGKFFQEWMSGRTNTWEGLAIRVVTMNQVLSRFPFRRVPEGAKRDGQILLMDRDRWRRDQSP